MALDSAQRAVPSWDDQIVPTLRKRTCPTSPFLTCETILPSPFRSARPLGASERSCPHSRSVDHSSRIGLESESAYLSSRLSSSQFHDHTGHSPSPSYGSPGLSSGDEGFGAGTTSQRSPNTTRREVATQSRIPVATSSRTRTKSSPFASPAGSPDPSCTPRAESRGRRDRDPGPSRLDGDLVSDTNGDGEEDHSPSKIPRRPRPTRPRSKSQLAPRTKFVDTDSHPPLPAPSSSIPRPSASRRGSSPSKPDFTRSPRSPASGFEYDDLDRSPSPELPHAKVVEGLVKNELPPFAIFPDDAMRIAERGHDLDDESDGEYGEDGRMAAGALSRSVGGLSSEDTRRRSLSKRPDARSEHEPEAIVASANRSKQTETGLGLPSGAARRTSGQNRSTSSKPAQLSLNSPLDGHGGVTVSTPRSASLNMLSSSAGMSSSTSSSRLGVAAHLVPPENAYTPPKGANWDEVLLPTVAKKLGMNEPASVERAGDEGDLAVEWDRDGTPVKWVKRGVLGNSQRVNVSFCACRHQVLDGCSSLRKSKDHRADTRPGPILQTPRPQDRLPSLRLSSRRQIIPCDIRRRSTPWRLLRPDIILRATVCGTRTQQKSLSSGSSLRPSGRLRGLRLPYIASHRGWTDPTSSPRPRARPSRRAFLVAPALCDGSPSSPVGLR